MKHSKPKTKKKYKRAGAATKAEKAIVRAVVQDSPTEVTPSQTMALAKMFNRSHGAVKSLVNQARQNFIADAEFYVDAHRTAVEGAIATLDFDVARKGAAWAIEHVSGEGKRIVDKPESGPSGVRIMVGVRIGGVEQKDVGIVLEGDTIETETET